jgi:dienelactone hydrolase
MRTATWVCLAALLGCASQPVSRFPASPAEAIEGSASQLVLPPGAGPHPAVIMLHSCGGMGINMLHWTQRLVDTGYAVLRVDSFGPRGERSVCGQWQVGVDAVAADAIAAAEHLRKLPSIRRERIFVVGFSYGAMAGLRLASEGYMKRRGATRFNAVVAFYPYCSPAPGAPPQFSDVSDNFYRDIATPVHLLLGGADSEAPSALCTGPADQRKAAGQPVTYTVFPLATHAFDTHFPPRGYVYDPAAVEQSWKEMREFLARH